VVAVVFTIDIPCLCSSYVVKGNPPNAGVQLGCLANYASEEKAVLQQVAMSCQMKGCLKCYMEVVASVNAKVIVDAGIVCGWLPSRQARFTRSRANLNAAVPYETGVKTAL